LSPPLARKLAGLTPLPFPEKSVSKRTKHAPWPGSSPAELEPRIHRALGEGRTQQALDLARQLNKQQPTPHHRELLQRATLERATHLRGQGYTRDAGIVLSNAIGLAPDDPAWLGRIAQDMAACGQVQQAVRLLDRLADPALRSRVLLLAADGALAQGQAGRASLPESLQPQFDLVVRAFHQSAAGQDEAAREALQGVGLQSPFLEWKLALRGLLAFYQADDVRALENWQRLAPERLPARLVAPLRFLIDPAYRTAQPPATQVALQKQADRLQGSGLVTALRPLQKALANEAELPQAFRMAENLLPALRQESPQFVPRLAACFYWAIIEQGQPEDMTRYRRVFGTPADDPNFDRLEALVYDQAGQFDQAHKHWQRFEEWVAAHPAVWPPGHALRVRALVWSHMGHNAALVPDVDKIPNLPAVLRDHPARPKPLSPSAEKCFQRGLELAPDRLQSYVDLLACYQREGKDKKAVAAARRLLERFPNHAPAMEVLADLLNKQEQPAEALALLQRAYQANPLERRLRDKVGWAHLLTARAHAEAREFDAARAEFQAALALGRKDQASVYCKWAACEFKAGNPDRAEELLQQALAEPGGRVAAAYSTLIEVIRLRLLPAMKKRFNDEFNAALVEPPSAAGATAAAATAAVHRKAGITYHGQKAHEKKVLAYVDRARTAEFTESQLESVARSLVELEARKPLRAYTELGRRQFPDNAYFPFFEAESYMSLGPLSCPRWKVQPLLEEARRLANQMPPDERQKKLLADIEDRQELINAASPFAGGGFLNAFENLFGGYDPDDDYVDDDWDDDEDEWFEYEPEPEPLIPFRRPKKKPKKRR
jgi:tetratricopeptide (TPR) repeat protein